MPVHLAERTRELNASQTKPNGRYVLLWLHHAVRNSENPALDAACYAAAAMGLPLLAFQGLGVSGEYDNDRHHTFVLEGARDVANRLKASGIRHVFHLSFDGKTVLPSLAAEAALVVTEDLPIPPFPSWSRTLAQKTGVTLWCVDSACVLPMQRVGRAYDRAFAFRRAHGKALLRRAALPYPQRESTPEPYTGALPFTPIDWGAQRIDTLVARCPIDHSVGPVPDTRGGTTAAEQRWTKFLRSGLAAYSRVRNNATLLSGTSRMSAYLHHGHIAPTQLARDAVCAGAEKFLDELLIWRELAYNYCCASEGDRSKLETLAALPAWARQTLAEHADDPRPVQFDWEQLARAKTGDRLWDAAQRSLLIHGELHNNVRMSWGKAFLNWTTTPERALALLFDLNNRFALDGSNPNSVAGLLWCLGGFDRPFAPDRSISGTVRTRSLEAHAKRLDLPAFETNTNRQRGRHASKIAVVGGGIAGLSAARVLRDQGFEVVVFDRGRRPGGRIASGKTIDPDVDYGAPCFEAKDRRFVRYCQSWQEIGLIERWTPESAAVTDHGIQPIDSAQALYVGMPANHAVAAHLARDLTVHANSDVEYVQRTADGWLVHADPVQEYSPFQALIIAMPAQQAERLVEKHLAELPNPLPGSMASWCVVARLSQPSAIKFDVLRFDADNHESGILSAAYRESSKPGRAGNSERWTIYSTPAWAAAHLQLCPDAAAASLLNAFRNQLDLGVAVETRVAHRWSYARPSRQHPGECLWFEDDALALCGDWCGEGTIEAAFLSGAAAAGRITASDIRLNRTS